MPAKSRVGFRSPEIIDRWSRSIRNGVAGGGYGVYGGAGGGDGWEGVDGRKKRTILGTRQIPQGIG